MNKTAITPIRSENFAEWYQEVIKAADLAENAVTRGCMVIKPWGYAIWEHMQRILDVEIKETGHENMYFPLLIPLSFFQKEAAHIDGFAKECAVVTHYRLRANEDGQLIPAPEAQLTEPYVIRPTSETVIGDAMAGWVHSYKDLPIKINQWANVMRWEMRTRLFLRTAEFLWQEGHTAHATAEEAEIETALMLDVYEQFARDILALPVIKGEKTPSERFPGALNTYCIEAMMQDGKALQAGTSHFLGQKFSKANNIQFTNKEQTQSLVWTTSWGVSTRLIGGLIMTHSDDDGLVLPPRVAPKHVVIIPVIMKEEARDTILTYCEALKADIQRTQYAGENIRVLIDTKDERAGTKFWQAVKKGFPIRIEVGEREMANDALSVSFRDKPAKEKQAFSRTDLIQTVGTKLSEIQANLLQRATQLRDSKMQSVDSVDALKKYFAQENSGFATCYVDPEVDTLPEVEEILKTFKLSFRCIYEHSDTAGTCIFSGKSVYSKVIIARAY